MIEKVNNNQVPDVLKESSSKQSDPAGVAASNEADASLQISYDSLIEKAEQIPPEDATAVQAAQQLLSSGQLESAENIRAAAENIIEFGI